MKTFPTLFKKTNTGATQQWTIGVNEVLRIGGGPIGEIWTEYGQVDGKLQRTSDNVVTGKNAGKKNATTAVEQAVLEAEAKWTKKQAREGYVQDRARAEAGETDAEGGIAPMLAKTLEDASHKVVWPCDAQRKLNGVRCIVVVEDGVVTLWSRKRKPILGVPHVQAAYEKWWAGTTGRWVFDGELYRYGWSLQKISGYVRKEGTKPGFEELGHHVYDLPEHPHGTDTWENRRGLLVALLDGASHPLHLVQTVSCPSEDDAYALQRQFVNEGYEGAMLRNRTAKYEAGKRSSNLLKVKSFKDAEFKILAVNEGRGKFVGKAVFSCEGRTGKPFDVCAPGTLEERAEFFMRQTELIGKLLTVKYFEESEDGTPLFPVGLAVRDYE